MYMHTYAILDQSLPQSHNWLPHAKQFPPSVATYILILFNRILTGVLQQHVIHFAISLTSPAAVVSHLHVTIKSNRERLFLNRFQKLRQNMF